MEIADILERVGDAFDQVGGLASGARLCRFCAAKSSLGRKRAISHYPPLFIFILDPFSCLFTKLAFPERRCAMTLKASDEVNQGPRQNEFPNHYLTPCITKSLWHYPLCRDNGGYPTYCMHNGSSGG
jgi:hypothetical protein